jgi:phosphomannomutase
MFPRGWALIRQSNTQPTLSFRAEGETPEEMERIKQEVWVAVNEQLAISNE